MKIRSLINASALMLVFLFASCSILKKKHTTDHLPNYGAGFLSLRDLKVSVGGGVEGALPQMMKSTVNPSGMSIVYKDPRSGGNFYPYVSEGISVDLFSQNSLTGLFGGINYSSSTTTYKSSDLVSDYFSVNRLEIPVYLKLREGSLAKTNHLWLLFGGIFSTPLSVNRQYIVNSISGTSADGTAYTYTDANSSQVNNLFLVSSSVGYETYLWHSVRGVIFIAGSYSINSQYNMDYIQFVPQPINGNPNGNTQPIIIQQTSPGRVAASPRVTGRLIADDLPSGAAGLLSGGNSVFANYPNYSSHEVRITLGIKLLLDFNKRVTHMEY